MKGRLVSKRATHALESAIIVLAAKADACPQVVDSLGSLMDAHRELILQADNHGFLPMETMLLALSIHLPALERVSWEAIEQIVSDAYKE